MVKGYHIDGFIIGNFENSAIEGIFYFYNDVNKLPKKVENLQEYIRYPISKINKAVIRVFKYKVINKILYKSCDPIKEYYIGSKSIPIRVEYWESRSSLPQEYY